MTEHLLTCGGALNAQVEQRLQAARFERQFGGREAVARAQVGTLRAACEEVRRNRTLPVLLQISLAAGNFLNWGNRAGGAAGFKIESLLKLKGLKSRLEGRTLLHFVAQEVRPLPNVLRIPTASLNCQSAKST